MKPLFDPSLISLDNAAEDFWQEYKRKQGLPVERVSESDLIKAEVELFDTMSKHSGQSPAECRQLLKEELSKLPKRETERERDPLRQRAAEIWGCQEQRTIPKHDCDFWRAGAGKQ